MIRLKIITIFLIAVSLSMDAFSLALIYGTQGIAKKDKLLLSLIVGVYHFIMPLIGVIIGNLITSKILINTNILVGIILSLIAVEMIISSFKETNNKFLLTFPSYLIFGLSVSIDSLTTGIGLSLITKNCIFSSTVFCVTSMLFTYLGLNPSDYIIESTLDMYINLSVQDRMKYQYKLLSHDLRNGRRHVMGLINDL